MIRPEIRMPARRMPNSSNPSNRTRWSYWRLILKVSSAFHIWVSWCVAHSGPQKPQGSLKFILSPWKIPFSSTSVGHQDWNFHEILLTRLDFDNFLFISSILPYWYWLNYTTIFYEFNSPSREYFVPKLPQIYSLRLRNIRNISRIHTGREKCMICSPRVR